jgi:hypothetical protein
MIAIQVNQRSWGYMKHLRPIVAFAVGFGVATALAVVVWRTSDEGRRLNTASDVYGPLSLAIESIEESAKKGDCEKAAAQLSVLRRCFDQYQSGGPTPADWWIDVVAATPPAH